MSEYKDNLSNMMCLDMYLASISSKEQKEVHHRIKPINIKRHPLNSWDISGRYVIESLVYGPKAVDVEKLNKFALKYGWVNNLNIAIEKNYDALVLTDKHNIIQWTNKGFREMTGYPAQYAIGQTPAFLQGEQTEDDVKHIISQEIERNRSFNVTLTNYRKNGESYLCEIDVLPLQVANGATTHFLAFEKEV